MRVFLLSHRADLTEIWANSARDTTDLLWPVGQFFWKVDGDTKSTYYDSVPPSLGHPNLSVGEKVPPCPWRIFTISHSKLRLRERLEKENETYQMCAAWMTTFPCLRAYDKWFSANQWWTTFRQSEYENWKPVCTVHAGCCKPECLGWSNRILPRKLKYFIWCLRSLFLFFVWHI